MHKTNFKLKIITIGIAVGIIFYIWGVLTIYKNIFPFEHLKYLSRFFIEKKHKNQILMPNPYGQERREQFELFSLSSDVVMIGDSLTQSGHWNDIFYNIKISNRGISNDRSDDVLRRINTIISVKPKKAFLMIGINDFNSGRSVDEVLSDYKKIVTLLEQNKIQVYIQSTLECSKFICGEVLEKVRIFNNELMLYSLKKNITFININNGLTSYQDGLLKKYTYDGIHLLGNGYVLWSNNIRDYVISK